MRLRVVVLALITLSSLVETATAAAPHGNAGTARATSVDASHERPRIGLALSGGAARGLAHVGVLKALHEMRVPVDLVAGTSMGSIVGGLFALGLTPAEIESALQRMQWTDLFSDKPNRAERSYRRKEDDQSDILDFELGIESGKLKLPRAFVAGQKLAFAFETEALHTEGLVGFDELIVPFRAVATDLLSGEMVVLERGSLVRALRASMSIPGFFSPVEIEGRLLVDGGVVRNLPIDVARDMGADVVIAVDVSEDLGARGPDQLASLLGLSFQLTTLVVRVNTERVLPLADVVLRPALGDLSIIEFERVEEAVRLGEEATRRAADALRPFALGPEAYAALQTRRRPTPPTAVVVDSIVVENRTRVDTRAVLERLRAAPHDTLDFAQLRRDLIDIYDFGSLELVDFELRAPAGAAAEPQAQETSRDAGSDEPRPVRRDLHLFLTEKTYAPNILHVGVSMLSDLRGRTRVQALGRLTRVELNRRGAEWRNDFRLGAENSVRSEWYQPLEFGRRWFTAFEARYANTFQDLYRGETRSAEYGIQEALARIDLGLQVGRIGELRSGFFGGWVKTSLRAGAGFPTDESAQGGWRARFALDRVDNADFPRRGQMGEFELRLARRALGSETRYDRFVARVSHFHTWDTNTVFVAAHGGTSLGTALPPHREFVLGGFGSLSGLQQQERRGNVLATARVGAYRALVRDLDIVGTDIYGAAWAEAGNVWPDHDSLRFADVLYTGTVALGADTLFGPVYFSYGRTHQGDDTIFLTVGRQIGLD